MGLVSRTCSSRNNNMKSRESCTMTNSSKFIAELHTLIDCGMENVFQTIYNLKHQCINESNKVQAKVFEFANQCEKHCFSKVYKTINQKMPRLNHCPSAVGAVLMCRGLYKGVHGRA
jgi:hypothetical protein